MQEATPLKNGLPHKIGVPGTSSTTYQACYCTSCLGTDGRKILTQTDQYSVFPPFIFSLSKHWESAKRGFRTTMAVPIFEPPVGPVSLV
jgi:hypothetical protein